MSKSTIPINGHDLKDTIAGFTAGNKLIGDKANSPIPSTTTYKAIKVPAIQPALGENTLISHSKCLFKLSLEVI
jgi:hypothetical protein